MILASDLVFERRVLLSYTGTAANPYFSPSRRNLQKDLWQDFLSRSIVLLVVAVFAQLPSSKTNSTMRARKNDCAANFWTGNQNKKK